MGKRNARVRDVVFKQSLDKVLLQFPGLTKTAQRVLARKRVEGMVLVIGAAVSKMSAAAKQAFVESTVRYLDDLCKR